MCGSWEIEHSPADGPTCRSMGAANIGVNGLLLEKKRGHQVCRELRAWEELRGGVEGEYVQNTLHEIVKELIKAI